MDYLTLQKKVRKLRDQNLIASGTKLTQPQHSLQRVYNRSQVNQLMDKAYKNDEEQHVKLSKSFAFKEVLNNVKIRPNALAYVAFENPNGEEKVFSLTERTITDLKASYKDTGSFFVNEQLIAAATYASDQELLTYLKDNEITNGVNFGYRTLGNKRKQEGAFFPYTHNLDFDLWRYQINNNKSKNDIVDTCFIHALKQSDLFSNSEINSIKILCIDNINSSANHVSLTSLPKITKEFKFGIILTRPRPDGKGTKVHRYNTDSDRIVNLGFIKEHYFINEEVKLTNYAIQNYQVVKDKKNWNLIAKSNFTTDKRKLLSSYQVITILIDNEETLLNPINYNDVVNDNLYNNKFMNIVDLEYNDNDTEQIFFKDASVDEYGVERTYGDVVFFDSETGIDKDKKHRPYLLRSQGNDCVLREFKGDYLLLDFLESLKDNSYCIAHNLSFDISFLMKYLVVTRMIQKPKTIWLVGKFFKKVNGVVVGEKRLSFNCSLAKMGGLIGLAKFKKVFDIDIEKDILPYGLYNSDTVNLPEVKIDDALEYIEPDDRKDFLNNIIREKCGTREGYFDHMKYSSFYCGKDVEVTKKGYNIFRKWMLEITGLDPNHYVTLSSLAYAYAVKEGCFDGCCRIKGIPREFIQRCIIGGRVMTNSNKIISEEECISDLDGVSLYPSAMDRLDKDLGGFLKGTPKVVKDLSYDFLKKQDGYFVLINITDSKIKRDFPLLNKLNDKTGVRDFNNNVRGEMYVDKITLEDLIMFHDIKFNVLQGYYFNEGRNSQIGKTIRFLFNERLKAKAKTKKYPEGNPIQECYKLLMNSIYGKTCLNPITNKTIIKSEDKLNSYLSQNYNYVNSWTKIPDSNKYVIDAIKETNEHFNSCHIGCEVLSMSKRIMNEVMCTAEDHHIKIYYQDTDSMHIDVDNIELLSEIYEMKYKRKLQGEQLGQFHTDFKLKGADEDKSIYAIKSIFLGKKSYIDKLEGTKLILDKDKKKIETDEKINGYHIRMKGIPTDVIYQKAKTDFDNDPIKLYEHLASHKPITFNILDNGSVKGKFSCKISNNFDIHNNADFLRTVQY